MNWKSFLLGLTVGAAGVYAAREYGERMYASPDKVLQDAKNSFKQQGPITGSWIQMEVENYLKNQLSYKVYKGGISRGLPGETEQFEFVADASTGTIIDVLPL